MPLLCGLLLLISAPSLSLADQRDQKSVESRPLLYETEAERRERLELVDLLNVALSTSIEQGRHLNGTEPEARLWFDTPEPIARRFAYTEVHSSFRRKLSAQLPWLYRRVFRADAMPRLNVINKWEAAPTIIVGFPEQPGKLPGWGIPEDDSGGRITPIILDEAARHLPTLREATGLNVGVSQNNSAVAPDSAIISIIPYSDICASDFNTFKVGHCASRYTNSARTLHDYGRGYAVFDILTMAGDFGLTSIVPFTPDTWTQVDGAIFPDEENRIDLALCFIWNGHTEKMVRSLVTECVFRAMGLPDISNNDRSIFSKWNGYLDEKVPHETKNNIPAPCKGTINSFGPISRRQKQFECEVDRMRATQRENQMIPSEYDIRLLKRMYSSDITRGHASYQIMEKLIDKEINNVP